MSQETQWTLTLSKESDWKNKKEWKKGIIELNTTLDQSNEIIEMGNSNMDVIKEIRRRKAVKNKDGEQEVVDLENEEEDIVRKKKVTFLIEYKKCTSAIEEVIKALEFIATIDIDTTPRKNLDSVIKILVSICVDLNDQMQTAQITMGAMSELIEDLLNCGEDVEALTASNKKLRTLVGDLKEKVEQWKNYNKHLVN